MSNITVFQEKMDKEYQKIQEEVKRPNIILLGASGVGKSSLINLIFGKTVAKVGSGKPITKHIEKFDSPENGVVLYDSAGYETGEEKQQEFFDEVVDFAFGEEKTTMEKMHLAWYCISSGGLRVTDLDFKLIKKFRDQNIPICVVLTKGDQVSVEEEQKMKRTIREELREIEIFSVTNQDIDNGKHLELKALIDWSVDSLEEGLKEGFIRTQQMDLELKKKRARNAILQHTAGSAGVGFIPIPFSDAPILLANQGGMVARIMYIYNLTSMKEILTTALSGLGIGTSISALGIWVASQLVKFIPGAGSIVGGTINAAVASAITSAIGFTCSEICYQISKYGLTDNLDGLEEYLKDLKPTVEELFKGFLKQEKGKKENK